MTQGTLLDGAGNMFIGLGRRDGIPDYGIHVLDASPAIPVYPSIEDYPWTRPPLKYAASASVCASLSVPLPLFVSVYASVCLCLCVSVRLSYSDSH